MRSSWDRTSALGREVEVEDGWEAAGVDVAVEEFAVVGVLPEEVAVPEGTDACWS